MKKVYLLVVKQEGQNAWYRLIAERAAALKLARAEAKRLREETYNLADRRKHGLAVIYRAATNPADEFRYAIIEVYEMPVLSKSLKPISKRRSR